jgi:chorismate mutase
MSGDPVSALARCREGINAVDLRLVELLNERTSIVEDVGRIKRESQMAIYEPKREDEVFLNVTSNNPGPLPNDAMRRIFERIMDEMRRVQKQRMEEKG